jgi:hypothetical protein
VSPRPWPLPFHPYCECEQLEVPPGADAPLVFTELPELMPRLSGPGQVRVVGLPSWWLHQAGLVSWSDLSSSGAWRLIRRVERKEAERIAKHREHVRGRQNM